MRRLVARHGRRLFELIVTAGIAAAVYVVIGIALAEQALHPVPRTVGPGEQEAAHHVAQRNGASLSEVPLVARDGALLRAWHFERPAECVFAVGASMGAAIVLQAAATEPFCAVVAEAPYATFRGAARLRVGRQFGLPPPVGPVIAAPLVEAALGYAWLRYGFDIGQASPADALRATRVPVLVIEDGDDDRMPAGDAARLAAANPTHVSVWHVPGARHVRTWAAQPAEYPRRVLAFFEAHQ